MRDAKPVWQRELISSLADVSFHLIVANFLPLSVTAVASILSPGLYRDVAYLLITLAVILLSLRLWSRYPPVDHSRDFLVPLPLVLVFYFFVTFVPASLSLRAILWLCKDSTEIYEGVRASYWLYIAYHHMVGAFRSSRCVDGASRDSMIQYAQSSYYVGLHSCLAECVLLEVGALPVGFLSEIIFYSVVLVLGILFKCAGPRKRRGVDIDSALLMYERAGIS